MVISLYDSALAFVTEKIGFRGQLASSGLMAL